MQMGDLINKAITLQTLQAGRFECYVTSVRLGLNL